MTKTATDTPRPLDPTLDARSENRVWKKFRNHKSAMIGGVLVVFFVLLALAAPLLPIPDPAATDWGAVRNAPSWDHWMGTDEIGRDVMARLIWGAQASLAAGVVSVGIAVLFGVPLGIVAGYFGGWVDAVVSRCTEALLAVPFLILAIALAAFLGPSLTNAMIAIGISATPIFVRLTRGQVLSIKEEDYVESARAVGLPTPKILSRYILPNVLPPILVQATLTIATAIIAEASLSFLGLGQQPPAPSWGSMLNTAKNFLNQAPWMAMWPGLSIFFVVLGFNLLGDGLRDALDPREH
ncbi:ABC transporter permease [Tateyamaria omphalii]|uniref:ABC transporter permease n=1 Tax=Tateyamaria omphalii TaxID=299262 RepID=UPI001C998B10|nr:ABC transporter permease [Tateyamaria omphalii]MBY5931959.1 ABC transporter permease [Tateyamaria omphalii]